MSKCCDKKMLNIKHVSIILLPLLLYTRPAQLKAVKEPHEQVKLPVSPSRIPTLLLGNLCKDVCSVINENFVLKIKWIQNNRQIF